MTGDDQILLSIYTEEVLALAAQTQNARALAAPDGVGRAFSALCGSSICIECTVVEGRLTDIGYDVQACTLGRAVAAIVFAAARGRTKQDVMTAGGVFYQRLCGYAEDALPKAFEKLSLFQGAAPLVARHAVLLLPFTGLVRAMTAAASGDESTTIDRGGREPILLNAR